MCIQCEMQNVAIKSQQKCTISLNEPRDSYPKLFRRVFKSFKFINLCKIESVLKFGKLFEIERDFDAEILFMVLTQLLLT